MKIGFLNCCCAKLAACLGPSGSPRSLQATITGLDAFFGVSGLDGATILTSTTFVADFGGEAVPQCEFDWQYNKTISGHSYRIGIIVEGFCANASILYYAAKDPGPGSTYYARGLVLTCSPGETGYTDGSLPTGVEPFSTKALCEGTAILPTLSVSGTFPSLIIDCLDTGNGPSIVLL